MKGTRRALIISAVMVALALVVTIVSVSAAWFSNSMDSTGSFVISSEQPTTSAVIDVSSSPDFGGASGNILVPAKAKKGMLLNGAKESDYDVLVADGTYIAEAATQVEISLPFIFYGAEGDAGFNDGKKSVTMGIDSATLIDPSTTEDALDDYLEDFVVVLSIVDKEDNPIVSTPIANLEADSTQIYWNQDGTMLHMLLSPNVTYVFKATIYFKNVDENVDPDLISLYGSVSLPKIYFNFVINAIVDPIPRTTGGGA